MRLSELSRRDWIKTVCGGAAASALTLNSGASGARADFVCQEDKTVGELHDGKDARPCRIKDGAVTRPAVEVPCISETDVLVAGGGPAGCVAAIAAARAGVRVALVERYGHFGGLATGGLVVHILGHWTQEGDRKIQATQGIGEEMMKRLEGMPNGIINREFGRNPTLDAEVYKYLLVEMVTEAGIEVFLHSWAIDAILDDNPAPGTGRPVVRGAVIQTKLGPRAILAKQVVDTTGDGDVFAPAGAAHTRRLYNIGLPCRIGNLDRATPEEGARPPRYLGDATPVPGVNWVNMTGPSLDGVDVRVLSDLELKHRRQIWKQYMAVRSTPGYENTTLLETAPQIGVRITRVIEGVETLMIADARAGKQYDDCVGIGGAWSGDHRGWQIPYGALVSKNVDNMITAGRSISGEPLMSDVIRVIPNCWVSGHAAGAAAAVAVREGALARDVPVPAVQELLIKQGAYLG